MHASATHCSPSFIAAAATAIETRAAGRKINTATRRVGKSLARSAAFAAEASGNDVLAVVAFAAGVLHSGELQEVHRAMHLPPRTPSVAAYWLALPN
jgi:hypothetical protein